MSSSYVYQITVSNPAKVANGISGACFCSRELAEETLVKHGFVYSDDAELWHNGSTEAWVSLRPINYVSLGVEEVQLR
jgi:hypothetical protein